MRFFHWITALLFPPKCVLCGRLLEKEETDLCHCCRVDNPECCVYRRKFTFLDGWAAIWYYEGHARESILRYKFRGARAYAKCYGRMLAMKLAQEYPDGFDALTWIPISSQRLRERGFDQVALLAQALGEELEMQPLELLKKILIMVSIFGVCMVLAGVGLADPLSRIFVGYDPQLLELTVSGFRIFALSFLFMGYAIFSSGFFTGMPLASTLP